MNLPNGSKVKVTKHGKLRISKDLVLNHVLHVPDFRFNLLFIRKLCEQLKCSVQFIEALCLLQGHSQKRPLVIGKHTLGLYILDKGHVQELDAQANENQAVVEYVKDSECFCDKKSLRNCNAASVASSFNVWHNRLGHMSIGKMSLHAKFHNNRKDFLCEIRPKQSSIDYCFQLAIYLLQPFLNYCILTLGDLITPKHQWDIHIFSQLWMIILGVHGHI